MTIPLAHDFNCPWCWIGFHQVKRLKEAFDVQIEWQGYELYPDGLAWPESSPREEASDRPRVPSRLELALAIEGLPKPNPDRPRRMRTHNAHEAVELAKERGVQDALLERLYRAHWEKGLNINLPEVLTVLSAGLLDPRELAATLAERRFAARITGFDKDAYAKGVFYVPTFWIGGRPYAEQPYLVLHEALVAAGAPPREPAVYADITFPEPPEDRPYTFINMVATIDGKTVSGDRDENVMDLGSRTDHATMRRLEAAADAVMIGASTLRATKNLWYPADKTRIVVTRSGDLDLGSRFFSDAPDRAIVLTPKPTTDLERRLEQAGVARIDATDLGAALAALRRRGIRRLLVEGGSELNSALLERELVDELFLTVAPKIKLGRDVPTYAGGEPLPRQRIQNYHLVERHLVGDEIFLRYRRIR